MQINKWIYYFSLVIIICTSFNFFASVNYPLLSSDDALNVLMTHDYSLPDTLYCWGQDRGGTIIPLISQFFLLFGSSSVLAISLSNYLIVIIGFLSFSQAFDHRSTKLLFALLWFFPFKEYIDLLRYPIGVQYSLVAFFFVVHQLKVTNWTIHLKYIGLIIIAGLAVWASDLAAVSLLLVLLTSIYFEYRKGNILQPISWVYLIFGASVIFLFIYYAKSSASYHPEQFLLFNNFDQLIDAISIVGGKIIGGLLFHSNDYWVSLITWITLLQVGILFFSWKKGYLKLTGKQTKWFGYLLLDFIVVLSILHVSQWVYAHNMGRWYFVGTYITLVMMTLIPLENLTLKGLKRISTLLVIVGIFLSTFGTFSDFLYKRPKSLKAKTQVVAEIEHLGEIGIIGDFWNSYILSVTKPDLIKATPHEASNVKNQAMVDEVFAQPKLYVVKDMWLKAFPERLEQFGYQLELIGSPMKLANCELAEYRIIPVINTFELNDLKIAEGLSFDSTLQLSPNCNSCVQNFAVYGPYIDLGIGTFDVTFEFYLDSIFNRSDIARLEVTASNGQQILASKTIHPRELTKPKINRISIPFNTSERKTNIEFRLYYYGNAGLRFKQIVLKEKVLP